MMQNITVSVGTLTMHLRVHSRDEPFSCDFSNLAVHLRVHSGDKPYACDTCGKALLPEYVADLQLKERTTG
jgi:hypothetical protein